MRTSRVFVYSLVLSVGLLFAFNVLIGYAENHGYPSALGNAFRMGLEVSVILGVLNWIYNRLKDIRRRIGSAVEQMNQWRPKWKK
jgi:hypothetical protein